MPRTTIADTAASLLAEHRALGAEELGRLIVARGATRSKQPARAVSRAMALDRRFRQLSDGRWAVPARLLEGMTLTHRLTTGEVTVGVLALTPDLAPLVAVAPDGLLLPDGRPLAVVWDGDALAAIGTDTDAGLLGPQGWLDDAPSGDLVHVRVTDGRLRIERGDEPSAASRIVVRRIAVAARMRLEEQVMGDFLALPPAVSLEGLLLDLLADDPGLLEHPLPPLGEAMAAAGLEVHQGFVGPPGTDWAAIDEFMSFDDDSPDDDSLDDLREAFDLSDAEVDGLAIVFAAYDVTQRRGGIDVSMNASLAGILARPGIASVLALKAWSDPAFEPFMADIGAAATGRDAAGALFVLGACAEARNDVLTAEQRFRSAVDADPDHLLALVEVARYETDRGDYTAALRHLREARIPAGDSERAWLEALVRPSVPGAGRNEPCPCGSGRKYKACHLDAPSEITSVGSAKALLHKLDAWLSQPNMQGVGEAAFEAIGAEVPADDDQRPVDPMVSDLVLFDRGGLRQFLDVRGVLLPSAELALGRTWLLTRRSLFEVDRVRPRTSVTLRDLRSDDRMVELPDRSISEQVKPLDLLLARLLPDGLGGLVATDGVLVPRPQRRHILDLLDSGDGLDLLHWIVTPAPMPRLTNTEGEPIRLMTVSYRVVDPAVTAATLRTKLRDDGNGRFTEEVVRHGQEWIRGSITLDGDRATIDANSTKRAARLEKALLRAAPGARLIRREERGIEEAIHEERAEGPRAETIDPESHPELAQAMEAFIRNAESHWVEERIPALGGLTPREAVADPAARRELDALLDDMAWQQRRAGGTTAMDPSRVRALLGIPERR